MDNHPITQNWLTQLSSSSAETRNDGLNYWSTDPSTLASTSSIHNFTLGTGESIYASSILPSLESAEQEVILVICFWARSKTLDALCNSLRKLSTKAQRRSNAKGEKIRVRIYFSSSSLFQKLFHPQTLKGKTWDPSTWTKKLGLPAQEELPGLDVRVKSIFLLPFSVMHPKFVVVDRNTVLLPSCNVSWEDWLEGCVELSGDVVGQFVRFWQDFWATEEDGSTELRPTTSSTTAMTSNPPPITSVRPLTSAPLTLQTTPSLFLPSPHHRNPSFAFLPWSPPPNPPPTPLNLFLLSALSLATQKLYIQTPNLTAPPILSALLAALRRGVDVEIVTSERLMVLEQLATAGTTTKRCLNKLIKRYERLPRTAAPSPAALEAGVHPALPGRLRVAYYRPRPKSSNGEAGGGAAEPVQSHLKLMIIDGVWTVLGSGNLDRASLFTSQELGVAFHSAEFAEQVMGSVRQALEGRRKSVFDRGERWE